MEAGSLLSLKQLGRLGFGAAAIGNLYAARTEEAAGETVRSALAAGLRYFDTAPHYGFGLSEARLGSALAGREDVLVSTKVGRTLIPHDAPPGNIRHGFVDGAPFEPVFDYSYDAVMRSWEESRRRLQRDRIDILLAHDLGVETHGEAHSRRLAEFLDGGYRAMRELRDAGAVGAIGLGVNEQAVCEEVLGHAELDLILLAGRYTLLEQNALNGFMQLCDQRGVKLIIGGPFNSGALVKSEGKLLHYNYAPAPPDIVERVGRLRQVCAAYNVPLPAAALQFPLAHPAVLGVIPGMGSPSQVEQCVAWLEIPIPEGLWRDLRAEGLLHSEAPTPVQQGRK